VGILIVHNTLDLSRDVYRWEELAAKSAIWTSAGHIDRFDLLAGRGEPAAVVPGTGCQETFL